MRISRSRVSASNSARLNGTVSTLPLWVHVTVACESLLRVRLGARRRLARRKRLRIGTRVGSHLLHKLGGDVVYDPIVPILAAQTNVALDSQRLKCFCDKRTRVTSKVPPPRS